MNASFVCFSRFAAAALLGVTALAACGGTAVTEHVGERPSDASPDGARAGDGGITVDASPDAAGRADGSTDAGGTGRAVDDPVTRVTVAHVDLGGERGCSVSYRSVDYVRATHVMTWPGCTADGGAGSYAEVTRTLGDAEAAEVEAALRAVAYDTNGACAGYDGPEYYLTTMAADGSARVFSAYDVNCYHRPTAPKIADAYAVLERLRG